MTWFSRCK